MPEFNTAPVIQELADLDVLPCVDVSDQQRLKQLTVAKLKESLGNGSHGVASITPPSFESSLFWIQVDADGNYVNEWVKAIAGEETIWVSRRTYEFRYFEQSRIASRIGLNPVPSERIYFESLWVSAVSRNRFDPGEVRQLKISLVNNNRVSQEFLIYEFANLADEERVRDLSPIGLVKPASDVLAIQVSEAKIRNPPSIQFVTVILTLREVYVPENQQ